MSGPTCALCGGSGAKQVASIEARPAGEVDYGIPPESYHREVLRCPGCDVYFNVHELLGPEFYAGAHNQATYGDRFQERYQKIRELPATQSDNKQRVVRVVEALKETGRPPGELKVLDVGTGLCVFLGELKDLGFRTTAVDPDPRATAHARDIVGVDRAHTGSLRDLVIEDRFDLISFNKVLEHVPDPIELLKAARPLLSGGGRIYLELPDGGAAEEAGGVVDREEFYLEHLTIFTEKSIRHLVEAAGLDLVEILAIHEPSDKYTLVAFLQQPR